jgi:O-antigen ligase
MPWLVSAAAEGGALDQLRAALPASWAARFDIWSYAAARVAQQPWLGWGLDASRHFGLAVPLHPHNAAMQVWLELGAVGAALFATVWAALFAAVARIAGADRSGAAACAGAAGAYFTIGALSFGVWQEWWLALAALAAAACAVMLCARARGRMAEPPERLQADGLAPL